MKKFEKIEDTVGCKIINMYTDAGYSPDEALAELAILLGSGMLANNQHVLTISAGEHTRAMTVEVTVSTPEGGLHVVK